MGTTQPIETRTNSRLSGCTIRTSVQTAAITVLIVMGLNTALRISDLLRLSGTTFTISKHHEFRTHFLINEQKDQTRITISKLPMRCSEDYFNERNPNDHEFIFAKTPADTSLSRMQAYRIVRLRQRSSAG